MNNTSAVAIVPLGRRVIYIRDLLHALVLRDIKAQYKSSILGILWSLINPLMQLMVFSFLFRVVLPLGIDNYAAFAFSGMLAWSWFQLSMLQATSAITSHRELIRRPGFPAPILPAITVTTNLINMLMALPLLLLFIVFSGGELKSTALFLPLLMMLQFVFTLSLAYLTATANVLFRDIQHLMAVCLQLTFYFTPVFYSASRVPEKYKFLYELNPMVHLVTAYRDLLLFGQIPNLRTLSFLALASVVLLVFGYTFFMRMRDRFVEEL
ncbi:MAG: ABC transporter permease [Verrucomicrobia bacterium]|nr:ABC transporter permease [Verrucomicrobiota bacterium]